MSEVCALFCKTFQHILNIRWLWYQIIQMRKSAIWESASAQPKAGGSGICLCADARSFQARAANIENFLESQVAQNMSRYLE